MAGYQFIHIEAYARSGSSKKRSLISIAQEADRNSGSHPHVITPLPPEYFLGHSFTDTAERIVAAADQSKATHSGKSRKIRKDANVGIGLIASHPHSLRDLRALPEQERLRIIEEVKDWADDVITFAQSEFPNQVQVAALHWDESYPHIHILIGNTEPTDDFQIIHNGERARKRAQGNDRTAHGKKVGNDAYTKEMRRFQDRFHSEVSIHHGQARLGPKRRRLTRSQWKKEQAQADSLALAQQRACNAHEQIDAGLQAAAEQAQLIVDATQKEARYQIDKAEQERLLAKQQYQEAEALKQQAEDEARQAEEFKQQASRVKTLLDERIQKLSRYDGFFGQILGWLGVRKRIVKKAEAKVGRQLASLKRQVESLSVRVNQSAAIKKQHDQAIGALKALQTALVVSIENYPQLKEKDALKKHFEYIQRILEMNPSLDKVQDLLNDHMDKLHLNQYPPSRQTSSFDLDD